MNSSSFPSNDNFSDDESQLTQPPPFSSKTTINTTKTKTTTDPGAVVLVFTPDSSVDAASSLILTDCTFKTILATHSTEGGDICYKSDSAKGGRFETSGKEATSFEDCECAATIGGFATGGSTTSTNNAAVGRNLFLKCHNLTTTVTTDSFDFLVGESDDITLYPFLIVSDKNTVYVKTGGQLNGECKKAFPCSTVQHALGKLENNSDQKQLLFAESTFEMTVQATPAFPEGELTMKPDPSQTKHNQQSQQQQQTKQIQQPQPKPKQPQQPQPKTKTKQQQQPKTTTNTTTETKTKTTTFWFIQNIIASIINKINTSTACSKDCFTEISVGCCCRRQWTRFLGMSQFR